MVDHHDAVPRGDPQDREEAHERPQGYDAARGKRAQHAADQGRWQCQEAQGCEPPASERQVQQHKDRPQRENGEGLQIFLGRLQFDISALQDRVIPERKLYCFQRPLYVLGDCSQVPSFGARLNVDAARSALALDDIGRRHNANIGHLVHADPLARGRIEQHPFDRGEAMAPLRRCPDLHIVGAPAGEDVADFLARHQNGRRAAHISRLQPVPQRLSRFLGNLYVGHIDINVLLDLINPLDLDQGLPHDFRLVAQDRQIGTEDTHDDRLALP